MMLPIAKNSLSARMLAALSENEQNFTLKSLLQRGIEGLCAEEIRGTELQKAADYLYLRRMISPETYEKLQQCKIPDDVEAAVFYTDGSIRYKKSAFYGEPAVSLCLNPRELAAYIVCLLQKDAYLNQFFSFRSCGDLLKMTEAYRIPKAAFMIFSQEIKPESAYLSEDGLLFYTNENQKGSRDLMMAFPENLGYRWTRDLGRVICRIPHASRLVPSKMYLLGDSLVIADGLSGVYRLNLKTYRVQEYSGISVLEARPDRLLCISSEDDCRMLYSIDRDWNCIPVTELDYGCSFLQTEGQIAVFRAGRRMKYAEPLQAFNPDGSPEPMDSEVFSTIFWDFLLDKNTRLESRQKELNRRYACYLLKKRAAESAVTLRSIRSVFAEAAKAGLVPRGRAFPVLSLLKKLEKFVAADEEIPLQMYNLARMTEKVVVKEEGFSPVFFFIIRRLIREQPDFWELLTNCPEDLFARDIQKAEEIAAAAESEKVELESLSPEECAKLYEDLWELDPDLFLDDF